MTNSELTSIKEVINKFGLSARKSLGQNFILDSNITNKIARIAVREIDELNIIEIGAGPGGLTRSLLNSNARKIYAVEKDERCVLALQELKQFYPDKLEIIIADALDINLTEIIPAPRSIIANLPYNIATILWLKWLEEIYQNSKNYKFFCLMFQKEVAERLCAEANSKEYGRISVISQWLCDMSLEFDLPPQVFTPPPKVMSSVLYIKPLDKMRYQANKEQLEKTLKAAFGNRRKMLRSALSSISDNPNDWLNNTNINPERRAETLTIEEFCHLSQKL